VSTTLALLSSPRYDRTVITLLDPYLPSLESSDPDLQYQNPHAASIDSSRIIRPDYADPAYARLASAAQQQWRRGFGATNGQCVYRESGIALTADHSGSEYVNKARENAKSLGCHVQTLNSREEICKLLGTGGTGGESGYVNWGSGWADNARAMEGVMAMVIKRARERGRVIFRRAKVRQLLFEKGNQNRVLGARLEDGDAILADLTVVAAGAWSGALVDLSGRAEARGQVMAYVPITEQEKAKLDEKPVLLNLSTGMFVIPPVQNAHTGEWFLKIARHSYGYANPTRVSPEGTPITTSLPNPKYTPIPAEGLRACRAFLQQTIPWLGDRAFSSTRICWYTDTPTGDFLISYHPVYNDSLFLATGGSGHGFKFLPVLGGKIVAAIEGVLEEELAALWGWRGKVEMFAGTEEGSRGGERGVVLEEEWGKEERLGRSKL
jgi:sarcosine oxidase/L-pipecolate oxidase